MNIGDYVRTKTGIHKVFKINENATVWKYYCDKKPTGEWDSSYEYIKIKDDDIIKSSPNIIDLIEENDLLKIEYYSPRYRERLTRLFEVEYKSEKYLTLKNAHCYFNLIYNKFNDEDKRLKPIIKLIVTKEQFESMEYNLESEVN